MYLHVNSSSRDIFVSFGWHIKTNLVSYTGFWWGSHMGNFEFFWVVPPCSDVIGYQCLRLTGERKMGIATPFQPEDGGNMDLRNVSILPQHYTASQSRRPLYETSSKWKPQNSHDARADNSLSYIL